MKRLQKITLFALVCTFIVSCSIEKRHYMPGYHVEWKNQFLKKDKNEATTQENSITPNYEIKENFKLKDNKINPQKQDLPRTTVEKTELAGPVSIKTNKQVTQSKYRSSLKAKSITTAPVAKQRHPNKITYKPNKNSSDDNTVKLVLSIVCLFLGLFPLAVWLMDGIGTNFWINLVLVIGLIVCSVLGAVLFAATEGGAFALFIVLGVICGFAALIHAIVVVVKNA